MNIQTIFAHVSCSDITVSSMWYEQLFGKPADRHPMPGLSEWQFTESAALQLYEDKKHAGASTLTIGVLSVESERERLEKAKLKPEPVEETSKLFIIRLRDPDENLVVLAGPKKS